MNREIYPTDILKSKFIPIRDVRNQYSIDEETIMSFVRSGRVMYALMKDPIGNKRIPHINIEQLSNCVGGIQYE